LTPAIALLFLVASMQGVGRDASPEEFARHCAPGIDDTACWQAALSSLPARRVVAAASGRKYRITKTLTVCNGYEGIVDGHGAALEWAGPPDAPMFLIVNTYHTTFTNFAIAVHAPRRLQSAFEFASAKNDPPSIACSGMPRPASKNSIVHVAVEGDGLNDIDYGVRFTNRYRYDANNDMTRIVDSNFVNITNAVVSVETTQSHQIELIDVTGYGAPGNRGCFVHADSGFLSSIGGFQGMWGDAAFCVNGGYGPFSIINANSEGSARLVRVGMRGDVANYPVSVNVSGGRFAVDAVAADGHVISFNRLGSLIVVGLRVDGGPPRGVEPTISVQPGRVAGSSAGAAAVVEGMVYFINGSSQWHTVIAEPWIDLTIHGNVCVTQEGLATACRGEVGRPTDGALPGTRSQTEPSQGSSKHDAGVR